MTPDSAAACAVAASPPADRSDLVVPSLGAYAATLRRNRPAIALGQRFVVLAVEGERDDPRVSAAVRWVLACVGRK